MGKLQLQEIILNEVCKFNNAINGECKKLGYMYFLLGLGTVSLECYHSHQWLMHAINGWIFVINKVIKLFKKILWYYIITSAVKDRK